jgi:hypothetical protein
VLGTVLTSRLAINPNKLQQIFPKHVGQILNLA